MKTWQIIGTSGMTFGLIEAVTPQGALDKYTRLYATEFTSYKKWCEYLRLPDTYDVRDNKILLH